ncbi:ankyrin repeat-containing domain protein [Polychytrium aggregatum]|uniref:ankyrin repeat-containing domain protein n=1 Tax=Polychytrium aggregatum TaxID=110093 RepID=UPI0022FED8D0|nr:ankyrin repeat-containing domain protein [Polychytrium aggregatum]KAI9205084.1 ankyrin repeat-containing domain protein [Polychytrium aggregatum]
MESIPSDVSIHIFAFISRPSDSLRLLSASKRLYRELRQDVHRLLCRSLLATRGLLASLKLLTSRAAPQHLLETIIQLHSSRPSTTSDSPMLPVMLWATTSGNSHVLEMILRHNSVSASSCTGVLHSACFLGDLLACRSLIAAGADVHSNDDLSLHYAAINGHFAIVDFLLGNSQTSFDRHRLSAIAIAAAGKNHLHVVKALEAFGADMSINNLAILRMGCCLGYHDLVVFVLQVYRDRHPHWADGASNVLLQAVRQGHEQIVRLLIESGVDFRAGDDAPFRLACENGHVELVRLLIGLGCDVQAAGNQALRVAAAKGRDQILRLLLESGADINAAHGEALRTAAKMGHVAVVQMLLEFDADVHANADEALKNACEHGHDQVVGLLLQHGADTISHGGLLLKLAMTNGHVKVVQRLLSYGLDMNAYPFENVWT